MGGEVGGGGASGKANLNATPATVNLGTVDVGTTSTAQTVTITNTGVANTVTVTPSGVGISASGCGGTLAAGGNCVVSITATPTAIGPIVGSVAVVPANGNAISISVTGVAQQPGNFTVTPTAINLGDVAVGSAITASVSVSSTVALTGLTTGVTGPDLKLDPSSTCTASLAASTPCKVTVVFNSATAGTPVGDAIVVSQGGVTKTIPVTANVLAPAKLAATPTTASLTAAPGSSSSNLDINVGNIGGITTGQITVALAGTNAADFSIVSDKCSIVTLAAGAYCIVTVKYNPAATVTAAEAATLTITDKGTGASSVAIALAGTPNVSTLSITPATGALGSVAPGSSGAEVVFTVSNSATGTPTGALAVAVNSAIVTVSSNTCATKATLAAGDSCTVGLKLTPSATTPAQAISGLLTVTGATAGKVSASFTGAVVSNATLTATPTSVSFGSVPVNQQSAAESVTIKNVGATATGTLAVTLAGTGAAQVAITANTCTGTLAPAATCTFSVQYTPTDTTGVNGTINVSDGSAGVSVAMVGTGLAPSVIKVDPNKLDFGSVVLGYSLETTNASSQAAQVLTVSLINGATTDSGTIATAFSGAAAADFAISAANSNCTTLQPGQTCTLSVVFTPSAVGTRTATLTVTGSKGGLYQVALTGKGLALVEIVRDGCTKNDGTSATFDSTVATSGLAFAPQTLGQKGAVCKYTATVRGATDPNAASTTASVALATSTPPDFRNVTDSTFGTNTTGIVETSVNPCNGAVLALTPKTGAPAATSSGNWVGTGSFWTCDFFIQFTPQTSKGDKTATLTASGSAGGTDTKTITGTATGPLHFVEVPPYDFGTVVVGTGSEPAITTTGVTLAVDSGVITLNVQNDGLVGEGPLSVALGGTNAGDFSVVTDACTATYGAGSAKLPATSTCAISIAFVPSATGVRTATLTVTSASSGETAVATLTGTGGTTYTTAFAPATLDFGKIAQGNVSDWQTFTISNPAGAAVSGKLTYGLNGCGNLTDTNFEIRTLTNSSGYPTGSCGDNNTKQLDPNTSCTIQVRFKPVNTTSTAKRTAELDVCVGGVSGLSSALTGTATAELSLTGSAISVVNNANVVNFGNVAKGATSSASFTVTNNSAGTIPLSVAITGANAAQYSVATDSGCAATLAAGQSCTLKLQVQVPINAASAIVASVSVKDSTSVNTGTATVQSASLTATPVANATLALYGITGNVAGSAPVEFGAVPIASAATNGSGIVTVTITNKGGLTATGLAEALAETNTDGSSDGFAVVSENPGTCASTTQLAPAATCTIRLRFKPTTVTTAQTTGDKTATLTITANSIASLNIYLHGTSLTNPATALSANVLAGTDTVYAFPSTALAGTASFYLELHNATGANVTQALAVGGQNAADFTVTSAASGAGTACAIASNNVTVTSVCQVKVTFSPTGSWNTDTRYRLGWVSVGGLKLAGLMGQVQEPAKLVLSASSSSSATVDSTLETVDFGQILETATPSLVFTITNTGEAATAAAVTATLGNSANTYVQVASTTCGSAALASGGTCTATVSVLPSLNVGGYSAGWIEATDGTTTSAQQFTLAVAVVSPAAIKLSPSTTQDLGTSNVGIAGNTATVTIRNGNTGDTGANRQDTGAVTVALSNSKDFILDTTACTPGVDGTFKLNNSMETCDITVQLKPTAVGSLSTTLTVSGTPGGTATLTITGTGAGDLSVAPTSTSAARTAVTATPVPLYITNNGAKVTGMLRTTTGGTNKALFTVVYDSCYSQSLQPGASCEVDVMFLGTHSTTADQTAEITVSDSTAANSVTAYVKG